MKTAIVSGASGLVGKHLLQLLLNDGSFSQVIVVARKPLAFQHSKIKLLLTDFEQLAVALQGVEATHAFCCLGTTLKTAGSKEKQYRIDHDYVVDFAQACKLCGVEKFAVVSSIGANPKTSNFYLQTKGRMEEDVKAILFSTLLIVRPSLLMGDREEFRLAEKISIAFMKGLGFLFFGPLKKYRGIAVSKVAACMVKQLEIIPQGASIIESDRI